MFFLVVIAVVIVIGLVGAYVVSRINNQGG
jgi:uncharacterized protein (UPF0333 family)